MCESCDLDGVVDERRPRGVLMQRAYDVNDGLAQGHAARRALRIAGQQAA